MALKNILILRQGLELVEKIDDASYARPVEGISRTGIGGHFRHCLDFYGSFLDGLATGRIDYNRRKRDETVETNRSVAIDRMKTAIEQLSSLLGKDEYRSVEVRADGMMQAADLSTSTIGRELQFLFGHTVHHYAVIAILLRLQGIEPGADFGVAPSTLAYWKGNAA